MCFRPAAIGRLDHKCTECGTNNIPEATMCARCFAPMTPLTEEEMIAQSAAAEAAPNPLSASPAVPVAAAARVAPKAPPVPPRAVTRDHDGADDRAPEAPRDR